VDEWGVEIVCWFGGMVWRDYGVVGLLLVGLLSCVSGAWRIICMVVVAGMGGLGLENGGCVLGGG